MSKINSVSWRARNTYFEMLLLNEIHIKPLFDYKRGNIVDAALNLEKLQKQLKYIYNQKFSEQFEGSCLYSSYFSN